MDEKRIEQLEQAIGAVEIPTPAHLAMLVAIRRLIAAVRERDDANRKLRHERDRAKKDAGVLTAAVDDWAETGEQHEAEIERLRELLRLADEMADAEDELHNYGQCAPACPPGDCTACDADENMHMTATAYRKARGAG